MNINYKHITFCLISIFLFTCTQKVVSQENPPIPTDVEVNPVNVMNFGSFLVDNAGGTLRLDFQSQLTPGPGVMRMNSGDPAAAAIFDVYANPGTVLSISHTSPFSLTGTNGGSINLTLDSFGVNDKEILNGFFITTEDALTPNTVFIGGTLTIGNSDASPPGTYNGSITVTFIQE